MSLEVCQRAVRLAEKLGADQAECFFYSEDTTRAAIRKKELKRFETRKDQGIAIRTIVNKSLGFYYTTNLEHVEDAVEIALKLARAGIPDPNFVSLPAKKSYVRVEDIYDKSIENLDEEFVSSLLKEVLEIDFDQRIKSVNSDLEISIYEEAIANSLGIEGSEISTFSSFTVEMSASEGDKYSGSSDFTSSRFLKNLEIKQAIERAHTLTLKGLDKKRLPTGTYPIIIDPVASLYLLCMTLNSSLNADLVQRKRSFLSNDLGQKIASEKLTVIDDGLLKGGLASSSFDGEGYPSGRNVLIEKGMLKNFMYDSYTAAKEGKESTGNAVRNGFRSLPTIRSRNLIFSNGTREFKDMIADVKKGIYLRSTFDTPNVITGEFSGMINEGFYVEEGEMKHSLLQAGLGISLRKLLSNIVELSRDTRWIFSFKLPYILIENVNIAGQ